MEEQELYHRHYKAITDSIMAMQSTNEKDLAEEATAVTLLYTKELKTSLEQKVAENLKNLLRITDKDAQIELLKGKLEVATDALLEISNPVLKLIDKKYWLECYTSEKPINYYTGTHSFDIKDWEKTKQSDPVHPDSVEAFKKMAWTVLEEMYAGFCVFNDHLEIGVPLPSDSDIEIKHICENCGEVGVCPECKIVSYAFLKTEEKEESVMIYVDEDHYPPPLEPTQVSKEGETAINFGDWLKFNAKYCEPDGWKDENGLGETKSTSELFQQFIKNEK